MAVGTGSGDGQSAFGDGLAMHAVEIILDRAFARFLLAVTGVGNLSQVLLVAITADLHAVKGVNLRKTMPFGQNIVSAVAGSAGRSQRIALGNRLGMGTLQKLAGLVRMATGITGGSAKFLGMGKNFGRLMAIRAGQVLMYAGGKPIAGNIQFRPDRWHGGRLRGWDNH